MNTTELKTDFYKRFNESASRLIFTHTSLPCCLLGDLNIKTMPSVACGLSMGVNVMARHISSGMIKLENTASNICSITYMEDLLKHKSRKVIREFTNQFRDSKIYGAEILYDTSIPHTVNAHIPLRAAIISTIARLNISDSPDIRYIAQICANEENYNSFIASLASKHGWCTYIHNKDYDFLPLPLTGYKIIFLNLPGASRKKYNKLMHRSYSYIKKLFPHITSFDDISHEMLIDLKLHVNNRDIFRYSSFAIEECERIRKACAALKACRLKDFADIVNSSQQSAVQLVDIDKQTLFLTQTAMNNGCLCSRFSSDGAVAIVSDDNTDYALKNIVSAFENNFDAPPVVCVSNA